MIKILRTPDINIVVAGGETQGAWKMISGALRATVVDRRVALMAEERSRE